MGVFLYHHHVSVCATKSRYALEEKGVKWDGKLVSLRESEQHTKEYLAMNPFGLVPVLIHDDKVVPESTVINEYIDQAFEGPALRPTDPYKLAQMRIWTRMNDENIHAAAGVLTTSIAYRHVPAHGFQISNQIDPYKKTRKTASFQEGVDNPHFRTALARTDMLLTHMEEALGGKGPGRALAGGGPEWLIGQFSLADIGFAPYIVRYDHLKLSFMWDDKPRVAAWYERLKKRPAFQRGIMDWFKEDISWTDLMQDQGLKVQPRTREIVEEIRSKPYRPLNEKGVAAE